MTAASDSAVPVCLYASLAAVLILHFDPNEMKGVLFLSFFAGQIGVGIGGVSRQFRMVIPINPIPVAKTVQEIRDLKEKLATVSAASGARQDLKTFGAWLRDGENKMNKAHNMPRTSEFRGMHTIYSFDLS